MKIKKMNEVLVSWAQGLVSQVLTLLYNRSTGEIISQAKAQWVYYVHGQNVFPSGVGEETG